MRANQTDGLMLVYKFGGASIATPAQMQALLPVIKSAGMPLVLVVSAFGKTTNALEAIARAACSENKAKAVALAADLEATHTAYAEAILPGNTALQDALNEHLTELHWAIDDAEPSRSNYWYDQIVCTGELLSTRLMAALLQAHNLPAVWMDARDLIKTNDTYRDAVVDETATRQAVTTLLPPLLAGGSIIITQGFIGATPDVTATTLGREGSDYTAALLGAMLGAGSVTIWKDVPGLLTADPRLFQNATLIPAISYREVIELAFYGAQVIHPKTIKPLQNAGIPLRVKCFTDAALPGTVISETGSAADYPPLIVLKKKQVLLQATTRDFSFITEDNLSTIYSAFSVAHIKVNLIQNAAIAFVACVDCDDEKIAQLLAKLDAGFTIKRNEDAELLTVRHYTNGLVENLTAGRQILLEQKTRQTIQVVSIANTASPIQKP